LAPAATNFCRPPKNPDGVVTYRRSSSDWKSRIERRIEPVEMTTG